MEKESKTVPKPDIKQTVKDPDASKRITKIAKKITNRLKKQKALN